ncbi:MAG TPA: hypothetical protein VF094_10435 [Gaiellaceae bacterium]
MARALSSALVLALLAATAVAFAITEGAKLERSPIYGTKPPPHEFSPKGTSVPVALFSFRLRSRERAEVWMENAGGTRVRTLLQPRSFKAGSRVSLVWDGLDDAGALVPDGDYKPVVKLERSHRTIVLPNSTRLDTVPPKIVVRRPQYPILSPDGDRYGDVFRVPYRVSEPAHGILYVGNTRVAFTLSQKLVGVLVWNGKVNGKPLPPRRSGYVLSVAAQDRAGNVSKPYPFAVARIRYVVLGRSRIDVKPRGRFAVRVSTDAPAVHWQLHGRSGVQRRGTLHFRAPAKKGVYHLYVFVGSHGARATVVVK